MSPMLFFWSALLKFRSRNEQSSHLAVLETTPFARRARARDLKRRPCIAMTTTKKTLVIIGSAVGVAVLAFVGFVAMFSFSMVSTVMTKRSPDRQHTAKLSRVQGIDVNFRVTVDGKWVYGSPDFAPVPADFREQLIWDTDSQTVVLEVASRRIFGYHVGEQRPLTDTELLKIHLTPFEELRFEGTLPKDVVIR